MNTLNCAVATNSCPIEQVIGGENDIVAGAKAGLPGAFAELYALYSRRLYRTIFAITRHAEDTEDALQETFMRAYLAIHAFEGRSTVYSWLTRIAINSALIVLRKRRSRGEMCVDSQPNNWAETAVFDMKDSAPNPEQLFGMHQRRMILNRAVGKLHAGLREPVQLRVKNECSLKEISQRLMISEGAVKARLHRARAQLSAAIEGA
jgi:RNA polymerase sigma-70 factor, ECF subfamily